MVTLHTRTRTWTQCKLGIGIQSAQGTPLAILPHWLWADVFTLDTAPQYSLFEGAYGNQFLPREANVLTHYRTAGELRFAATDANLLLLLPWISQAAFAANVLGWSAGLSKYASVAIQDHPVGGGARTIRLRDALPLGLTIESSIATQGILLARVPFLAEGYTDEAAGASITFTQANPVDREVFRHNEASFTNVDSAAVLGLGRFACTFPTGVFPWEHDDPFPLLRKDGNINPEGEIETIHSDETDPLRRNAAAGTYAHIRATWLTQAPTPRKLTLDLNDLILTTPPPTGVEGRRYIPFRGRWTNMGQPTVTLEDA